MTFLVTIDWKIVLALGVAASVVILASKTDSDADEQVLTYVADACKESAVAVHSNR